MHNTNYFGRFCRFIGRILLFIGFTVCLGVSLILIINPFTPEDLANSSRAPIIVETASSTSIDQITNHNSFLTFVLTGLLSLVAIAAIFYLAYKYNATLRNIIAKIAHRTKIPIHHTELGLTLLTWSILTLLLFYNFPIMSIFCIFMLTLNELAFIFAWISYGLPLYEV